MQHLLDADPLHSIAGSHHTPTPACAHAARLYSTVGVHPTRCGEIAAHPRGPDAYLTALQDVIIDGLRDGKASWKKKKAKCKLGEDVQEQLPPAPLCMAPLLPASTTGRQVVAVGELGLDYDR